MEAKSIPSLSAIAHAGSAYAAEVSLSTNGTFTDTQTYDNGQLAEGEILDGGGESLAHSEVPKDAVNFRIALPPSSRLTSFVTRVHKTHSGPFAPLAELDVEPAK